MKQKIKLNLGNEFAKECKIDFSKTVPVTKNFDHDSVIGYAEVYRENDDVFANIEMSEDLLVKEGIANFEIGGKVIHREGNLITDFKLYEVSMCATFLK